MKPLQELMSKEHDYTIRLYSRDLPKEECDTALFLNFNGDSCVWLLRTFRRVPYLRKLSKSEKKHLWSKRWLILDEARFERFPEARKRLIKEVNILKNKGYTIKSIATGYDLPPW